jgi:gamma-glutamylcyclotransferase (GGCT)/AIG2-like uncharacterized protein YtfP
VQETGPTHGAPDVSMDAPDHAIFAYGSLMYTRVWESGGAGRHAAAPATLRGFQRRRIAGEPYPALIVGVPSDEVRGVVYTGVSPSDLTALDRFEAEGRLYARIPVTVRLDGGPSLPAWTYLYLLTHRVQPHAWDPDRFATRDLSSFLASYRGDRAP